MGFGLDMREMVRRWGRRGFWGLMLAAHTPAWLTACLLGPTVGEFDLLRAFVLTLSQIFFLLKLFDVPWLRAEPSRRAWITLIVAVAFLHAGLLPRVIDGSAENPVALPAGFTISAALAVAWGWGEVRRKLRLRDSVRAARAAWHTCCHRVMLAVLPPRHLDLTRALAINRAPPA